MQSMYIQSAERQVVSVARCCYDYYTLTATQSIQWEINAR